MSNAWTAEPQDKEWFKKADWLKRHEAFLARTAQGGIDVLMLGDSITEGWAGEGRAIWQRDLAPLKAANYGIGGDEVQHVLWRVLNGEADSLSPKVVTVLAGTNNIGNVGHKAQDVARGVEALVETLRHKLPQSRILLHAVFPRSPEPDAAFRKEVAELNRRIAPLAGGAQVTFFDITRQFIEPDGRILPTVMPDALHLTPRGYEIWAAHLVPAIKRLTTGN